MFCSFCVIFVEFCRWKNSDLLKKDSEIQLENLRVNNFLSCYLRKNTLNEPITENDKFCYIYLLLYIARGKGMVKIAKKEVV